MSKESMEECLDCIFEYSCDIWEPTNSECIKKVLDSPEGQSYLEGKGYVKKEQDKQDKFEEKYLPFKRKNRR